MILDSGICKIYKMTDTSAAGDMPNETLVQIAECWFGDLSFGSSPVQHTDSLEQVEIARKIRILQNKAVIKKAVVVIGSDQYNVERVFHGIESRRANGRYIEENSGELISDLSLSQVVSAYDTE